MTTHKLINDRFLPEKRGVVLEIRNRAPTTSDKRFPRGTMWLDTSSGNIYFLTDPTGGSWSGSVPDASETTKGILELATQVETDAGVDDLRAVTPLKLATNLATKGLITWSAIAASQPVTMGEAYIVTPVGTVDLTLPAAASIGDQFKVITVGALGDVKIVQNAGQTINMGINTCTTGAGGFLQTTRAGDSFTIVCTVANTNFAVIDGVGNLILT